MQPALDPDIMAMLALAAMIFSLILGLLWLFLPFVIIGKFNRLIKLAEQRNDELEAITRHTKPVKISSPIASLKP